MYLAFIHLFQFLNTICQKVPMAGQTAAFCNVDLWLVSETRDTLIVSWKPCVVMHAATDCLLESILLISASHDAQLEILPLHRTLVQLALPYSTPRLLTACFGLHSLLVLPTFFSLCLYTSLSSLPFTLPACSHFPSPWSTSIFPVFFSHPPPAFPNPSLNEWNLLCFRNRPGRQAMIIFHRPEHLAWSSIFSELVILPNCSF